MIRYIFPAALALTGFSHAAILIQDDFSGAASADINGRTPTTNTLNSSVWQATTTASASALDGSGLLQVGTNNNRTAGIALGTDYFVTNPGIYELSYTINHPSNYGDSWVAFGFSGGLNVGQNLTDATTAAGPWLFYRANGAVNIRPNGTTGTVVASSLYAAGNPVSFRFVLNTATSQWSYDLYINGAIQDLNGGAAGTSYTYTTNPSLGYIAIGSGSSGGSGTSTGDNFTFSQIPEPSHSVMLGASLGLLALRRRR